jgi:NADPH2:quinone reductase
MKAIVVKSLGGPEVLELDEVPDPVPRRGEVLVRVRAAGVNPVETYLRAGSYTRKPPLPWTPGTDAGGVVEAVGEGVSSVRRGDRVYTIGTVSGSYAELAVATEMQVVPLPEKISFAQGAALSIPYTTAWVALFRRARIQPGEVVLVHGASGGVGTAAVELARAAGAIVFGTAGTPEGEKLVRDAGAHETFDHREKDHLAKAVSSTGGRGLDVIVEMLANENLNADLEALAPNGRVVVVGSRGRIEIDPRLTMTRDSSVLGMSLNNQPLEEKARIQLAIVAGLENGTLRPVVGRELPLAQAAEAHRAVLAPGARGKIVLVTPQ